MTELEKKIKAKIPGADTGIEITFPAEYAQNPEFIEFTSTSNGLIRIELKNIGSIENK